MADVDAALVWPSGKAFFFSGDRYVRWDVGADAVDEGYPQPIASGWAGVFPTGVDAAVVWPNGKAFFFSGEQYVRYDIANDAIDDGYPMAIADSWPGLFTSGIDAAVAWPNGKAYFFSGDQYVRWDIEADTVDDGYPMAIADSWPGLPTSGIDAVAVWPAGKAFFFSGTSYYRYDIEGEAVDEGYPKPIDDGWPGVLGPAGPIGPVEQDGGTAARDLSVQQALAALQSLVDAKEIVLEGPKTAGRVDLDGWDPVSQSAVAGSVSGVVVRYWASGTKHGAAPSKPNAPDGLDPRNALALVRLCRWLRSTWGVTELYHVGIDGGGVDAAGNPRVDCHGQGRAVDFVGVKGTTTGGAELFLTVFDDWGHVTTPSTPNGAWPAGTGEAVHYRLDDEGTDQTARQFFAQLYAFIATQWQDHGMGTGDPGPPSSIGQHSAIMNPDHPTSSPEKGKKNGREAHATHVHMQIGVTGTA